MKSGYFIALCLYLIGLAIRTSYEMLKKAGKVNPQSVPLFISIFTVMCILWISWFGMCPQDPLHLPLPDLVRWTGLGIFVVGLGLTIGALIQLRGVENIDHLVTTGSFAKLRHPMYLGFILWIFGWAIYHGAVASLIAGLAGIGNIIYWRHFEEKHLERTYGERYTAYRRQTWF
ncbi:MAG: isoprenylcysteine carboxylmethyltransferase family protein [candidate division Zixibacteria bacterium]|nr:isoprenylcysteine carboxylmethyltransferase family protein [candidate division Zixibacteria bacterium]